MTKEKQCELLRILKEWEGTSFLPSLRGFAKKGRCADCVSFPIAVYTELGIIKEKIKIPDYDSTNCGKAAFEQIIEGIQSLDAEKIWNMSDKKLCECQDKLQVGDLIVCSSGSVCHHLLIYAGNEAVYDCYPPKGVAARSINLKIINKHARYVFRFTN